ncbi:MAG TPA: SAM-dependent methyltransferase [Gammaproteobacteria bacterium]|nr:SAM-dependent methyltransferase [Gammaproteobacteria bacterium]
MSLLPTPDPIAQQHSNQLTEYLKTEIATHGALSFARYMELALYAPGLGYYSAGTHKFGSGGDFTTAPEISPLFGQTLAKQIQPVLETLGQGDILEFGAGSGRLAIDILTALQKNKTLPQHYYILELSPELQQRQQNLITTHLPDLENRVSWLNALPSTFQGVVLANEALDAMPASRFQWHHNAPKESYVTWQQNQFCEFFDTPHPELAEKITQLEVKFSEHYTSEIHLTLPAWIASIADFLQKGLVLLIDYGFPRHEYYHPDRSMGTLMCHYQHLAHTNPFYWPGLQDITAHIDFTAIAEAAIQANLSVAGYTTQAHFLLSCGQRDWAVNMETDIYQQLQTSQQLKKLLLPSEMGELFKVIALTRGLPQPLLGFTLHDMREKL